MDEKEQLKHELPEIEMLIASISELQTRVIPYIRSLPDHGGYIYVKAQALRKLLVERLSKQL